MGLDEATTTTASTALWSYDPHPELITSVQFDANVVGSGTGRTLRIRADGGAWVVYNIANFPGGFSHEFFLTTPVHMATLEAEWSPSTVLDLVWGFFVVPKWY